MTPDEYEILFGERPPDGAPKSESTNDSPKRSLGSSVDPANLTGVIVALSMIVAILALGVIGVLTGA